MAKSEPQTDDLELDDLRERLSGLLSDWGTEISAVLHALENQQSSAATQVEQVEALRSQVTELNELRQRVRDRDLALDYLKKKSNEKDVRFAALEKELETARGRIADLERQNVERDKPSQQLDGDQQAEFEAMRAELAARKSLVKSLRTDAERSKTLEKELQENRDVIARMQETIGNHAKTITELRLSCDSWERKYRRLVEGGSAEEQNVAALDPGATTIQADNDQPSCEGNEFTDSDIFLTETAVALFLDEAADVEAAHTIVIDMTEPLREAHYVRHGKTTEKG
jgi:chromosome segregation ATPase